MCGALSLTFPAKAAGTQRQAVIRTTSILAGMGTGRQRSGSSPNIVHDLERKDKPPYNEKRWLL
jgi:hypothetical protein